MTLMTSSVEQTDLDFKISVAYSFYSWAGRSESYRNGQFFPPASLSPGKDQAGPFFFPGEETDWLETPKTGFLVARLVY